MFIFNTIQVVFDGNKYHINFIHHHTTGWTPYTSTSNLLYYLSMTQITESTLDVTTLSVIISNTVFQEVDYFEN
jgi:hypothetical protein